MAISTFDELKTHIANTLNRSDLTSQIPTFIAMAESYVHRSPKNSPDNPIPGIRHWRMENRATAQLASRYLILPTDWLETKRVHLQGDGTTELEAVAATTMAGWREDNEDEAGTPQYYAHVEGAFEVYPTPDATYTIELLYYQRIPALGDAQPQNWLLTYHPDVYLYGALMHSAPYLKDDPRLQVWSDLYRAGVHGVNQQSKDSELSGTAFRRKNIGLG